MVTQHAMAKSKWPQQQQDQQRGEASAPGRTGRWTRCICTSASSFAPAACSCLSPRRLLIEATNPEPWPLASPPPKLAQMATECQPCRKYDECQQKNVTCCVVRHTVQGGQGGKATQLYVRVANNHVRATAGGQQAVANCGQGVV